MKQTDWISVKDMLPEVNEQILMVIEMKYDHESQMQTVVEIGWLNNDGSFEMGNDWYEGQQHFEITHWQKIVLPKEKQL